MRKKEKKGERNEINKLYISMIKDIGPQQTS